MPRIIVNLPESFSQENTEFLTGFLAQYLDGFKVDYSIEYEPEDIEDGTPTEGA